MPYLLDADTLIRAKNDHYGFALCPGFWEWLVLANDAGIVFSVQTVLEELLKYGKVQPDNPPDQLATWAKQRGTTFFLEATGATYYAMERVAQWAHESHYRDAAVRDFLDKADSWLVAEGSARQYTVVTHEVSSPESVRRVKIPDACAAQTPQVGCITLFEMLRLERAVFVLAEDMKGISP